MATAQTYEHLKLPRKTIVRSPYKLMHQIEARRLAKGLTFDQLGKISGWEGRNLGRSMRTGRSVSLPVLHDIAEALGCEIVLQVKEASE